MNSSEGVVSVKAIFRQQPHSFLFADDMLGIRLAAVAATTLMTLNAGDGGHQ